MKNLSRVFKMIAALTLMAACNLCAFAPGNVASLRLSAVEDDKKKSAGFDPGSFEERVIEGIEKMETANQTLLKDITRLDKETKSALEDLTKVKNAQNGHQVELTKALRKFEVMMARERYMAFGDPIARIEHDEQLNKKLNLLVRQAVTGQDNILKGQIESIRKALGEDTSPGSTLIVDDLLKEIYDTLARYGKWSTLGVRRLGKLTTKMPIKTARPTANFVLTEGGTIADDTDKAGTSVSLTVEVIAVLLNVSLQLLEDAETDVTRDVLEDFMEAYNYRADYAAFMADGTADATNGGFTGLYNFGTAAVATTTHTSVATLTLDDFIRCLTTVDPVVLERASRWWTHPTMLARIAGIKDANGRPLFQTALEAPSPGAIGSILGYPVELVHVLNSTDGVSKKIAAFGDPQSVVTGVRRDYAFEASDQHKWNTLQRSFRGWGRFGVKGRRALGSAILTTAAS